MDWKRGEVASQGNHLCSWEVWGWWMGLGSPGPYGQVRGWMLLGGLGLGDGAGCSWARWAGAPNDRPEPCSPSIRKRCARGLLRRQQSHFATLPTMELSIFHL